MKAQEMREISAKVASEADAEDAYKCVMVLMEDQANRGEFYATIPVKSLSSATRDFTTPICRRLLERLVQDGYRVKFINNSDPSWIPSTGDCIAVFWDEDAPPRFVQPRTYDRYQKPGGL